MMFHMTKPRCWVVLSHNGLWFQAIFARGQNGFVGAAKCFVRAGRMKQLHGRAIAAAIGLGRRVGAYRILPDSLMTGHRSINLP
jgi:hypothetical protein